MTGGLVQIPVSINRASNLPIQDQLVGGIRELIVQGAMQPGIRLPATRDLSQQLKVSRNTVKLAYSDLISQGYLESKATSGTFVCCKLPDVAIQTPTQTQSLTSPRLSDSPKPELPVNERVSSAANVYDFSLRKVDSAIVPDRTWRRLLLNHLPYRSRQATSLDPAGLDVLRQAIASLVSPLRGMSINPRNSLIVTNDYRAFDAINKVMLRPGASVAIEDPCDAGLFYLLESCGIRIIPVPVDQDGMIVDELPPDGIKLVYVSPTHQRPTGATMSVPRRQQLLEWAARTGAHIVEWDTFGEFCYDDTPLPSLFSMDDHDRVIYVNLFSTWIGADLELGYVVAPQEISVQINSIKLFVDSRVSWLDQRVAADFISSDSFFGHLRRIRQAFKQRRDAVIETIEKNMGPQSFSGQNAGQHLVWHLPVDFPSSLELQAIAASRGISLPTLYDGFRRIDLDDGHHDPDRTLLLGYSGLSEDSATEGIELLADILGQRI